MLPHRQTSVSLDGPTFPVFAISPVDPAKTGVRLRRHVNQKAPILLQSETKRKMFTFSIVLTGTKDGLVLTTEPAKEALSGKTVSRLETSLTGLNTNRMTSVWTKTVSIP